MLTSLLLQAFVVFVLIVIPREIDRMRPYAPARIQPDEVIYYSGDELPRVQDAGGAQSGAKGRAGGREAHHRTQTIRVARGASLAPKIVDAPNLKLPSSAGAFANLLAFKANPGPPPSEGMHSTLVAPRLPSEVIAPAPVSVDRDQSRRGVTLNSVIAPAPEVANHQARTAPTLNSAIVPPAPSVLSENRQNAPLLESRIIAPPSTHVSRDQARSAPSLNSSIVPPAPTTVGHEVSPSRVQMNVAVVPPPVSAPERDSQRISRLNMPAPSVVAPPPSADSSRDLRRLESGGMTAASRAVVPPPPSSAGNGSFVSSVIGKLFGTQDVVPPPPSIRGSAGGTGSGAGRAQASSLGDPSVIPPPPSAAGSAMGRNGGTGSGSPSGSNGGLLAGNVVPPPPSLGSGADASGSGSGRKGVGLGGPGDAGSALAPPKSAGGTSDRSGVLLSTQPGSTIGMPGSGGKGSLAMSPSGGDQPGLGGSGGGAGIGHGEGTGSGMTGEGPGAGKIGAGYGSDTNANGGISPTPGLGGAGSSPTGSPAVSGVDVRGGSTIVTLPSFGSDGGANDPNLPGRSSIKKDQGPAITIVATSRSGGAFDFYGQLPGDNYTVYVDTSGGTVVMQFAEAETATTSRPHLGSLTGPQGLRTNLPAGLSHARVVIKCKLDASGNLRNLQVLEPGPAAMTAKIMAALPSWKFRPAMRGAQPVEVNALLGFNINTNDRNN
jgi:hypothetical protein